MFGLVSVASTNAALLTLYASFIGLAVCMLFIKTSKCFTVQCSFTVPAGAGAVIPVSEGSDGGHCWPVGGAVQHRSTKPLWTTLQLAPH